MKSLKDFNYLLSLDRRYTKTESEIFRLRAHGPFAVVMLTIVPGSSQASTEG